MPNVESEPTTHWHECWRDPAHHACAVRRIEEAHDLLIDALEYIGSDGRRLVRAWLRDIGEFDTAPRRDK